MTTDENITNDSISENSKRTASEWHIEPTSVYDAEDVANILKVHVSTVRNLLTARSIQAYKVGRQWKVRGSAIIAYLLAHSNIKLANRIATMS